MKYLIVLFFISNLKVQCQNSLIGKWNVQAIETNDYKYDIAENTIFYYGDSERKYSDEAIKSKYKESYFVLTKEKKFYYVSIEDYISIHLEGTFNVLDDNYLNLIVKNPAGKIMQKKAGYVLKDKVLILKIDMEDDQQIFTLKIEQ